jgi:Ca2+-binding RTX toxin-like protein
MTRSAGTGDDDLSGDAGNDTVDGGVGNTGFAATATTR